MMMNIYLYSWKNESVYEFFSISLSRIRNNAGALFFLLIP